MSTGRRAAHWPGRRTTNEGEVEVAGDEAGSHLYGGQAVVEGVMMRGASCWAVAVRRPDQSIWVERHEIRDRADGPAVTRTPFLRGVFALADSVSVGLRALGIAAEQAGSDPSGTDEPSPVALGAAMTLALVIFVGLFIVLPSTVVSGIDRGLLDGGLGDGATFHLVESALRIAIFLGYLAAISRLADIRRVFEYHGAEHMTISAWEAGGQLTPDSVDRHATVHVRCGTNFLILVMLLAVVVYTLAGALVAPPSGGLASAVAYHVILRVVLLPVVAGLAYEALRLGARQGDRLWVRALMQPGLWLQRITTRPPDHTQIEVAIRAFEAVVSVDELAGRVDQTALPSRVLGPAARTA